MHLSHKQCLFDYILNFLVNLAKHTDLLLILFLREPFQYYINNISIWSMQFIFWLFVIFFLKYFLLKVGVQ